MNASKISSGILVALVSRGWDDEAISEMSPEEAFGEYCMWHGLIGYGPILVKVLGELRAGK